MIKDNADLYMRWDQKASLWEYLSQGGPLVQAIAALNAGGYAVVARPEEAWWFAKKAALWLGAYAGFREGGLKGAQEVYDAIDLTETLTELGYYAGKALDPLRESREREEAVKEMLDIVVDKLRDKTIEGGLELSLSLEAAARPVVRRALIYVMRKSHLDLEQLAKLGATTISEAKDLYKKLGEPRTEEATATKSDTGPSRLIMQDGSKKPGVGGVRGYYDRQVLRRALNAGGPQECRRLLSDLVKRLDQEKDVGRKQQAFQKFFRELKAKAKASRGLTEIDQLALVSVKALVTQAEKYAGRWDELPQELRTPGNLARIRGFVLDGARGDILILGSRDGQAPSLQLDDLIVAVRAIWKEGGIPTCSLDPDPAHFAARRAGPQKVRLIDLPRDCGFALAMLDADYTMKKVLFGTTPVRAAGFTSLKDIMQKGNVTELQARFWFIPVPTQLGDVQVAEDGRVVLFQNNLEVLTEQVALNREGQLAGTGGVHSAAEEAAASLNRHWTTVEREQPHFQNLQLLMDLVMLCDLWRAGEVSSPLLDRLAGLPYRKVAVPESYPGITQTIPRDDGVECWLYGGVQLKVAVGPRTWLVHEDDDTRLLRKKALELRFDRDIAASLSGVTVHLPTPSRPNTPRRGSPQLALRQLAAREWQAALVEADRAVAGDPDDPLPRAARALARLASGLLSAAQEDAIEAQRLALGDPDLGSLLVSVVQFGQGILRDGRVAVEPGAGVVVRAGSKEAALLRGTVLLLLGRAPEAREELQKAIDLDPGYASAHARLALLESDQGFRVRAKQVAEKAVRLLPNLAEAKAVLARSEFRLRHLSAAEKQASEVIAQPFAEIQARGMAYEVLVGVAARRGEWQNTERLLQTARKALPRSAQVPVWLFAADEAHDGGRDDLSSAWLIQAERLAPRSRAVAAAKQRLAPARSTPPTNENSSPKSNGTPSTPAAKNANAVPPEANVGPSKEADPFSGWIVVLALALIGVIGTVLLVRRYRRAG
jgi:tetratricopeptide (TPR) repeat protein